MKSLPSSEWLLVASLLAVMGSLLLIARVNAHRAASSVNLVEWKQEEILVTISGAVSKPGEHKVLPGTTVAEVLRKARPKSWAKLGTLPLDEVIESPLQLHVEELSEIKIFVKGAIAEPVEITVPAKSRICDLKSKLSFTSETDLRFFRRKRRLKEGEIIEVPKKTVEDN